MRTGEPAEPKPYKRSLRKRARDYFDDKFFALMNKLDYEFGMPTLTFDEMAKKGDVRKIKDLIPKWLGPNERLPADYTLINQALVWCPKDKIIGMLTVLLDKGSDVNGADYSGSTPIMLAASRHSKEVINLLLKRGANIHARSKEGHTALMNAAREGRIEIIELFLNLGADINAVTNSNHTALTEAITLKQTDAVKFLLARGADPSIRMFRYGTRTPDWDAYQLAHAVGEAGIIAALEKFRVAKIGGVQARTEHLAEKATSSNRMVSHSF